MASADLISSARIPSSQELLCFLPILFPEFSFYKYFFQWKASCFLIHHFIYLNTIALNFIISTEGLYSFVFQFFLLFLINLLLLPISSQLSSKRLSFAAIWVWLCHSLEYSIFYGIGERVTQILEKFFSLPYLFYNHPHTSEFLLVPVYSGSSQHPISLWNCLFHLFYFIFYAFSIRTFFNQQALVATSRF